MTESRHSRSGAPAIHPDPNSIDLSCAPAPADGVRMVLVDTEAVLLDEHEDRLYVLDRVGALVWQCIDRVSTLGELAEDLADGFGAPRSVVERDVLALVRSLGEAGLLHGSAPSIGGSRWGAQVFDAPTTDPRFVGSPPSL